MRLPSFSKSVPLVGFKLAIAARLLGKGDFSLRNLRFRKVLGTAAYLESEGDAWTGGGGWG